MPTLLKDVHPGPDDSDPNGFVEVGGLTFFSANDGSTGYELWKSDGTDDGTVLVKNINPGASSSYPSALTNVGGTLFFRANNGANGFELWKSDGTDDGTVLVEDINPGGSSNPSFLTNVSGTLFFSANNGADGIELWKSNGSAADTEQVEDINPGSDGSNPGSLTNVSGTLYFSANDGTNGYELWKSEGTAADTEQVKDINPGGSSFAHYLTNVSGTLFFSANDGTNGFELWKSDGTDPGTVMVKDIDPGGDGSNPYSLTNVSGTLFFGADDGTNGYELWKSDGFELGTVIVKDINPAPGDNSFPFDLANVSGTLFFGANDGTHGYELWKSDGTQEGTVLVKDIDPNPAGANYPFYLTNVNGTLYFRANDGTNGNELWKSDGTTDGTTMVADIDPSGSSYPSYLTNSNGILYFSADDGTHGREPWTLPVPIVVTVNGDADFPNQADTFLIERDAGDPSKVNILRNGVLFGTFPLATLEQINVHGLGGNDSLTVDATNGLVTVPGGIHYDGGTGFDNLKLLGGTAASETLAIGAQPGSGKDTITANGNVQVVDFQNIEPIVTDGAEANFSITSVVGLASLLQEANAINYIQSEVDAGLGVDGTWGKVTVDNFEPIYFQNKTDLTIDAGAGSDEINLNNPTTPAGLENIFVNGDDPTASDVLIVNGTPDSDFIVYAPQGADAGVVTIDDLPTIDFDTVEHLIVNSQGAAGLGDSLQIDPQAIAGTLVLTPGASFDSGRVDFQTNPDGGFIAPSLEFLGLDNQGALTVVNDGEEPPVIDFVYRGTDLSDTFTVFEEDPFAGINLNSQIPVGLQGVRNLTLAGLDGDDEFNVPPDVPLVQVNVDAGNPDGGSDVLNYQAVPDAITRIAVEVGEIVTTAGNSAQVDFTGVETLNVLGTDDEVDDYIVEAYGSPTSLHAINLFGGDNDNDDGDMVNVTTTLEPDTINFTPLSTESARITGRGPEINIFEFNNDDGNLLVGNPGNVDTMNVLASSDSDTIDVVQVSGDTTRATVTPDQSGKWVPVDFAEFTGLTVDGGLGDDALVVDNSNGLVALESGITYDGNSGVDELQLIGSTQIDTAVYTVGQQPDAGTVVHSFFDGEVTLLQKVFFTRLEPVFDVVAAASLTVNATNADNAVNYTEGPNSNTPVTGLVSVDGFETIEFANKTLLVINALAGSDEINLNNPVTPTGLEDIQVNGGDPTASDTLIVNGTPDSESITYRPNGADSGTVEITVPALPLVVFDTIEHLTVNGRGESDLMQIDTSEIDGTLVLTPGSAFDRGRVDFQTNTVGGDFIAPSLDFLGIDRGGRLNVRNVDGDEPNVNFVYRGTDLSDFFEVESFGVVASVYLNAQLIVNLEDVFELKLAGLDGDDRFLIPAVAPFEIIRLDGGNPGSGSDELHYPAEPGSNTVVDFEEAQIDSSAVGSPSVFFVGVETINVLGTDDAADDFQVIDYGTPTDVHTLNLDGGDEDNNDDDTIEVGGTAGPDTINYTPLSVSSARITRSEGGPEINVSQFNNEEEPDANLTIEGNGGVDAINVFASAGGDTISVIQDQGTRLAVTDFNGSRWVPVDFVEFAGLTVFGGLGNDTLVVDNSNGLVDLPSGITYDGGSGSDALRLTGQTQIDSSVYTVGPAPGAGSVVHTIDDPLQQQQVFFNNLEPFTDDVVAAMLTVDGTNASNAISYTQSEVDPVLMVDGTWGKVTVDEFEPTYFQNKSILRIRGLAGSDTINLNNPANPTGLTTIVVLGGEPTGPPTGADTVIVNGNSAANNIDVLYAPASDEARVAGAQQVPVEVEETEKLIIDGRGGGDTLSIGPDEFTVDVMTLTPGPERDAGSVLAHSISGVSLIPIEYLHLGGTPVAPATLPAPQPPTANFVSLGPANTLIYNGTAASDVFYADDNAFVTLFSTLSYLSVLSGADELRLNGLAGDDAFNVYAEQPNGDILIDGGEPGASDTLNLIGTPNNDTIEVNFFSPFVPPGRPLVVGVPVGVTVEGLGGTIGITGVEGVNLAGAGGTDTLAVNGTIEDDVFTYTPTRVDATADDGRFTNAGFDEVFTFNGIAGAFTIDGGAFDVADEVIVVGTSGPDFIDVDSPTRTVTVQDAGGTVRKPVVLGEEIEIASIQALGGNDTILVTPAPATATGPGGAPPGTQVPINLLINVDGGGPGASDALVVAEAGGEELPDSDFVVINRSRTPDQGVVRVFRDGTPLPDITYVNTEIISPILPPPANPAQEPNLLILGPDNYEQNEFLSTAAFLGSAATINVSNLAIFPNAFEHRFVEADNDWFRVVAQNTGTLDFQVYFREFASAGPGSIPGGGNLSLQAFDVDGDEITGFGTNDDDANERIRIPVVAGQTYYLRVFGATDMAFNGYDMTVINEAPPVPYALELYDVIVAGDVAAGVSNTVFTSTSADLSMENDAYNGKYVHFTSGNVNGLRGLIEDYAFAAGTATFTLAAPLEVTPQPIGQPPLVVIPGAGSSFEIESNDTGISQHDNVTRDDTPTIFLRLDDGIFLHDLPGNGVDDSPPDQVIPIPFQNQTLAPGYRIAIFDEGDVPPQMSDPPQDPVGFASPVAGQEGVYMFTFDTPLSQGSHFITARVQMIDPADPTQTGFGGRSLPLEIFVDVQSPPVFFGLPFLPDDGLDAGSDTGVIGLPETFSDGITANTTPTFFGTAEAGTVVKVFVDLNDNAMVDSTDFLIGQTVATPIDGTEQFPGGRWVVRSNVDLNNPEYFPKDGLRTIMVTAEDVAGNESPDAEPEILEIFLDTTGPQVTEVFITDFPQYGLFGLKPDSELEGPTPLIFSLTIRLQDLPPRVAGFLYEAIATETAETPGVITLVGDHNGIIEIDRIIAENLPPMIGMAALATITLEFDTPIPDDRFTLTVNDTIVDLAGNQLDGESDAAEPIGAPFIPPSGDGQPGGDFIARFTVDSRPEIGTYAAANVFIDANGNFFADFPGEDDDFTNRDLNFALGIVPALQGVVSPMGVHDGVFAGDFPRMVVNEGAALVADGFDKLAAYGFDPVAGGFRWLIDVNHDGIIDPAAGDHATIQPAGFQINGLPVAGDFDGNPTNGDEIGLFDGTRWHFDTNHNYVIDGGDLVLSTNLRGTPITGDFNGDGILDLATWRNDRFEFNFGTAGPNWSGLVNATINWGLPGVAEVPVAADMDMDGITDIGLFLPARSGTLPSNSGNWQFLISNDFGEELRGGNQVTALDHPFSPSPLGNDLFAQFGDSFALPVVGNFDPPVAAAQSPAPMEIGPVLGEATAGPQSQTGEQWYAFQPLRSGSIDATAMSSGGASVTFYSQDFVAMPSAAPTSPGATASTPVTAGSTYLVRVNGSGNNAAVRLTANVAAGDRVDTTRDGRVSAQDVLYVVNELLAFGSHATPMDMHDPKMYLDTTLDGRITAQDVLTIVNYFFSHGFGARHGEAAAAAAPAPSAVPAIGGAAATTAPAAGVSRMSGTALTGRITATSTVEPTAADVVYTQLAPDEVEAVAGPAVDAYWADADSPALLPAEAEEPDLAFAADWDFME